MNVANLRNAAGWFEVLQTVGHTQTAVMTLEPGGSSGEKLNTHPHSDQVLLVLEGEVRAEISGETTVMKAHDVVIVPRGQPHQFSNAGKGRALTFSVYAPPAYPE